MKHKLIILTLAIYSLFSNTECKASTKITDSQREVVAAVICLEAGGEGRQGMQAVMSVIANRSNLKQNSYYDVVRQPKQFSCLNGVSDSAAVNRASTVWHNQWEYALQLVEWAEDGTLQDITGGATSYHNTSVIPGWAWKMKRTCQIKNHIFYK